MVFDLGKIRRPQLTTQLLRQLPMVDRNIFTPIQNRIPQINLLEGRTTENNASYVRRISELSQIAGRKIMDYASQCRADYLEIKEYERIGRVMNPYRQSNPSAFRTMRFAYDVSGYAFTLAGEAKVYAEEFIDSHPKLRTGLDVVSAKTKEASQKIYEFAEPMVLKAKDYAFQCLSDYLKAKEERESIAEYESGPMALGINWLLILDRRSDSQKKSPDFLFCVSQGILNILKVFRNWGSPDYGFAGNFIC